MIQRTEREAGTVQRLIPINRRDRDRRSWWKPIQEGSFTVHNAFDHHHAPSNLAFLEPLRDPAQVRTRECIFLGRLSRQSRRLYRWLMQARDNGRTGAQPGDLDDHTLSDIGLTRIEMLYGDRK